MRAKTEAKEAADAARKSSIKQTTEPAEEESEEENAEDNKAWNLTKQLKSRMKAMHGGRNNKSRMVTKRKNKFKEMQGLSDGDTTPSDFDPDDSAYDETSGDD